jgi:hypothetical protein
MDSIAICFSNDLVADLGFLASVRRDSPGGILSNQLGDCFRQLLMDLNSLQYANSLTRQDDYMPSIQLIKTSAVHSFAAREMSFQELRRLQVRNWPLTQPKSSEKYQRPVVHTTAISSIESHLD